MMVPKAPLSSEATASISSSGSSPGTAADDTATTPTSTVKKLHGRAFYESIGSPRFILAPMVDQSEFAWRLLTRSFMPPSSPKDLLAYTPMLHARMFTENVKFRDNHFQPLRSTLDSHPNPASPPPTSSTFLDGNPTLDRPLFTQFCANDPDELLDAAKYVAPFCDAVDLNLGCPQGIARKGKYGAFLQEDQELIFSLINKLHLNLNVPVTAKIRVLETKEKTLEYARNVVKAGASILSVHGRQREQKGHKTGLADWSVIRFLREQLPRETVLFANGNILRREDIDRCLEETGADGVMSAEGNLYDPSVFSEAPKVGEEGRQYWRGRDGKGGWRMDATFRRYMDIIYKYVLEIPAPVRKPLYLPSDPKEEAPTNWKTLESAEEEEEEPPKKKRKGNKKEKTTSPNLIPMQAHLFKLLRPLVAKRHNIRDALARSQAGDIAAFENVLQMVEVAVEEGMKKYEETDGRSWEDECANDEKLKEKRDESATSDAPDQPPPLPTPDDAAQYELWGTSVETVKACKRPWWVVQPYVRPLPIEALAKGSLQLSKKDKLKARLKELLEANHVKAERKGNGSETTQVTKDGLVCG